MNAIRNIIASSLFILLLGQVACGGADPIGALTVFGSKVAVDATIGSMIDKAEGAGKRVLADGENRGDALISRIGDQVTVAARNLNYLLEDQREKLFSSLNIERDRRHSQLLAYRSTSPTLPEEARQRFHQGQEHPKDRRGCLPDRFGLVADLLGRGLEARGEGYGDGEVLTLERAMLRASEPAAHLPFARTPVRAQRR